MQEAGVTEANAIAETEKAKEKAANEKAANEKAANEKAVNEKAANEKAANEKAANEKAENDANGQRTFKHCVLVAVISISLNMILIYWNQPSKSSAPDLEKMHAQIQDKCSQMFATFQIDAKHDVSDIIEVIKRDISMKVNDDLKKTEERLVRKGREMEQKYDQSLHRMQETFTENMTTFATTLEGIDRAFSDHKEFYAKFEVEMNERTNTLIDTLKTLQVTLKDKLVEVNNQLVAIKSAKEEADKILGDIKGDVDKIYPNTFNKGALTTAFCVLALFVFSLAFWIYRVQQRTDGNLQQNTQMPRSVSSSKGLCIISFDEERQAAHEALVRSALQTMDSINIQCFVVRRHEQLVNMPRCSLYIMCTEFSERHIIIEEPGLGLGDLKRSTYQTVQRFRAELVILYTRDPGSRHLRDQQLYNTNIYCVSTQPELVRLRDQHRFYSLYDELSNSQQLLLKDTIVKCTQ